MNVNYKKHLLVGALSISMTISSFAQIIENGTYQIFNSVHSEMMMVDESDSNKAKMTTPNENDDFQLWTFTHQGDDVYIIENVGSNSTLGINDGWCGVFGDVRAGFANTDENVEFKIVPAETTGTYVIQIAFTECNFGSVNDPIKAFDIQDGAQGANIQTFDVDASNPNQQFQIGEPGTLSNDSFTAVPEFDLFFNKQDRSLNLKSNDNISQVEVYDLNGRTIKSIRNINQLEVSIDLTVAQSGLYLVKYSINNKVYFSKTAID